MNAPVMVELEGETDPLEIAMKGPDPGPFFSLSSKFLSSPTPAARRKP